uniref:Divergent PAP2 family protein n=1 Tax=candidate division WOR-3 bacterium TaxID=2052148 RepID=A0A7C4UDB0_UNCW3
MGFYSKYNIIIVTALCMLTTQFIKIINFYITNKRFNFIRLFETGGIPSSHAASSVTLTTLLFLKEGAKSSIFALALYLTIFIIYEAGGVRRHAGRQAMILNTIIEEIYRNKPVKEEKLKELIGHTPVEVFVGILYGFFFALALYR